MAEHVYSAGFYDYIDAGSTASAQVVTQLMLGEMGIGSLLDVGAGHGAWAAAWLAAGVPDVVAVDGDYVARDRLAIPPDRFVAHDLTSPLSLGRRFDLVQSLEVAEHLPEARAGGFVQSLVDHGDIVLFSSAVPNQGGEHHVNEQPPDYWRRRFAAHGYAAYDWLRPQLQEERRVEPWYRFNSVIYANAAGAARLSPEIRATRLPDDEPLREVGDLPWLARRAMVRLLPAKLVEPAAIANAWFRRTVSRMIGGENRQLLLQLIRYIFTGGFVTLIGQSIYTVLILHHVDPHLAAVISWTLGIGLGYTLHSRISFADHGTRGDLRRTGGRFLAVNLVGLALNLLWVTIIQRMHLPPLWANMPVSLWANVPMVALTPILVFALHRHWSFR